MKQRGWIATAGILFALIVGIETWPAWQQLNKHHEWHKVEASANTATLNELQVTIEAHTAAIAAQRPERAALLVRLKLHLTPAARQAWTDCQVSLHNETGQIWMPLTSASADGAIKALAPDHKNAGACRLYAQGESEDEETLYADQLFLLPSNGLQGLQLHVSGLGTRPEALSFELNPEVRKLP